jgi:hypothetical protein
MEMAQDVYEDGKVKENLSLYRPGNHKGERSYASLSFRLGTGWRWLVRLISGKEIRYSSGRGLAEPRDDLEVFGEEIHLLQYY